MIFTILLISISIFPIIYLEYKKLLKSRKSLLESNLHILKSLGNAIAKRDSDTNEHNYRVTFYAIKLAEFMELKKSEIEAIIKGAFLHDVGKIGVSDNILLKPAKLSKDEFEEMKKHTLYGIDIISGITWLHQAKDIILYHHEKYDGNGYPYGLESINIPLSARIFAAVDVFDALTSKRPYKEPFSPQKSFEIINLDKEKHFDPIVVEMFSKIYLNLYQNLYNEDSIELENIFNETLKPYFKY